MMIKYITFGYDPEMTYERKFVCYFHHTGFNNVSIGISVDFRKLNLEIHLPFGFLRIGWNCKVDAVLL